MFSRRVNECVNFVTIVNICGWVRSLKVGHSKQGSIADGQYPSKYQYSAF